MTVDDVSPSPTPDDKRSGREDRSQPRLPDPSVPASLLSQPRPALAGLDRRTVALSAAILVVVWLVLVFGRAVSQANQAADQAAVMRQQNAVMAAQLQERRAELSIIQSPQFLALQARAYGYGTPNEQVFALQPGSSAPPAVTPLGQQPPASAPPTPLQAWLNLLFGSP